MKETIQTPNISITVNTQGAEMSSLFDPINQREYIWQADPKFWPRHAPILFPIVGKVKDNQYQANGEKYPLTQHGFARDQKFMLVNDRNKKILCKLTANEETLDVYPFYFELDISYALLNRGVEVSYTVKNTGKWSMPFSLGAHPGFNILVNEGEQISDYYLEFELPETAPLYYLSDGLIAGISDTNYLENQKIIALDNHTFDNDALIFKQLQSSYILLKNRKGDYELKLSFKGFPFLGIWAKKGAPFICIEPWFGIADTTTGHSDLSNKEGIINLPKDHVFSCSYTIELI